MFRDCGVVMFGVHQRFCGNNSEDSSELVYKLTPEITHTACN